MAVIDPKTVVSPKSSVRNVSVLWNGGAWDEADPDWSGWSLATLDWDGSPSVGVRWNGHPGDGVGNPQSRGLPTWMILPGPIAKIALDRVTQHLRGDGGVEVEPITPRRRLLDLIAFVRSASHDELSHMIEQMDLRPQPPAGRSDTRTGSGPKAQVEVRAGECEGAAPPAGRTS